MSQPPSGSRPPFGHSQNSSKDTHVSGYATTQPPQSAPESPRLRQPSPTADNVLQSARQTLPQAPREHVLSSSHSGLRHTPLRAGSPSVRRSLARNGDSLSLHSHKRARASSPSSDTGTVSSDLAVDADSPLSFPHVQRWPSMSDTGSEPALLDGKALRLDDVSDREQGSSSSSAGLKRTEEPNGVAPSPPDQASRIHPLLQQPLQDGQAWYLVSRTWFRRWSAACVAGRDAGEEEPAQVGPIDCSDLVIPGAEGDPLAHGLQEGQHYEMVPEEAWQLFVSWYGICGPTFARQVVSVDGAPPILEVYPPTFHLLAVGTPTSAAVNPEGAAVSISRASPLLALRQKALEALQLGDGRESTVRLWLFPAQAVPPAQLAATELSTELGYSTVQETSMTQAVQSVLDRSPPQPQPLALEVADSEGKWPSQKATPKRLFAQTPGQDSFSRLQRNGSEAVGSVPMVSSNKTVTRSQTAVERSTGKTKGLKGLVNLGNTCFMNSALQCLSNTPELKEYFVSRVFEQEVNEDNPLGNAGALAQAFGSLTQQLWSGQGSNSFAPRDFKWSLARFAPQFSGYAQQDTQELLAFLLDGLHEDLNRIKKKPYIEAPDWEGGGLEEMVRFAKKQWDIYKLRNDSVIVDLFQGQYRSTLVCPVCAKVSIKFDPFMYLTLPLPNKTMWKHLVVFVPYDRSQGTKVLRVMLSSESSISTLKSELAQHFGISDAAKIIGAEVFQRKFYRYYYDYEPLHSIEKNDHAVFWESPHPYVPPAQVTTDRIYMASSSIARDPQDEEARNKHLVEELRGQESVVLPVFSFAGKNSFGSPFFIGLSRGDAADPQKIAQAVLEQYKKYSPKPEALVPGASAAKTKASPSEAHGSAVVDDWDRASASGEEIVAEIRADGHVVEQSEVQTQPRPTTSTVVHVLEGADATDATDATATGDLPFPFQLHYVTNLSRPIKDVDHWRDRDEPLVERARRLEAQRSAEGEAATFPLVYKGGALVCCWDEEVASDLLYTGGDNGKWGENIEIQDDKRVAAEKAEAASSAGKRRAKKELNIDDCLDEFTREEQLGADDPWYCPQCKDFRQATKKFDLWKVPDILVVHLKRFSAGRGLRDKLDINVDFPIEGLDLTDRVEGTKAVNQVGSDVALPSSGGEGEAGSASSSQPAGEGDAGDKMAEDLSASILSAISEANDNAVASDKPIYDLFAVDNHFGGLGGGHYTACAKNVEDHRWYYFDDSHVRPIHNPDEVKGSAAYVLFYRRRTARAIGGKSREIVRLASATPSGTSSRAEPAGHEEAGDTARASAGGSSRDPYRHPFRPSMLSGGLSSPMNSDEEDEDTVDRTLPGGFSAASSNNSSPMRSPRLALTPESVAPPAYDPVRSWDMGGAKPNGTEDDEYDVEVGRGEGGRLPGSPRSDEPDRDEMSDRADAGD